MSETNETNVHQCPAVQCGGCQKMFVGGGKFQHQQERLRIAAAERGGLQRCVADLRAKLAAAEQTVATLTAAWPKCGCGKPGVCVGWESDGAAIGCDDCCAHCLDHDADNPTHEHEIGVCHRLVAVASLVDDLRESTESLDDHLSAAKAQILSLTAERDGYKQACVDTGERIAAAEARAEAAERERDDYQARKDGAYEERNRLVAVVARMAIAAGYSACRTRTAIEGWSDDWHNCIYIELPCGQASWHFHDSQGELFADLPERDHAYDGHTTEEKYAKLAAWRPAALITPENLARIAEWIVCAAECLGGEEPAQAPHKPEDEGYWLQVRQTLDVLTRELTAPDTTVAP